MTCRAARGRNVAMHWMNVAMLVVACAACRSATSIDAGTASPDIGAIFDAADGSGLVRGECLHTSVRRCGCPNGPLGQQYCGLTGTWSDCACDAGALPPDASVCTGRTEGGCYVEDGDAPLCPCRSPMPSRLRPAWRVTHVAVARPSTLATPTTQAALDDSLRSGRSLLGVQIDTGTGSLLFGAFDAGFARGVLGRGLLDGTFRFASGDLAPMRATVRQFGWGVSARSAEAVVVPLQTDGALAPLRLPLCEATVVIQGYNSTTQCIGAALPSGGRFDECTSAWRPTSATRVEGYITITAARSVRVPGTDGSLCDLLAGTDCGRPLDDWPRGTDAFGCGEAAWRFEAAFAATPARVD